MTRTERIKDQQEKSSKRFDIRAITPNYPMTQNWRTAHCTIGVSYRFVLYESGKHDFVDECGSVFLIYTVEELMELLDKSNKTITKIKKN